MSSVKIFSGNASRYLADSIAENYGRALGDLSIKTFSDGEISTEYKESVRGAMVFVVQSTSAPTDNIMELLLAIDAAKRASADYIVAVIPYFGYARQDRKDRPRVAIGSKLVANMLTTAGADRIMTMDLHASQIQGFFDIPFDHLEASYLFMPYIKKLGLDNLVIAAPDVGSSYRARIYAHHLGCEFVICDKFRKKANEVAEMTVIGDVTNKNVVMVDDLIDTGGTLAKAAKMLTEHGAKSVRAFCTHPVLSGNAYKNIEESVLEELVVCDTIPLKEHISKIKVLSVGKLFARAIRNVHEHESISSLFVSTTK
jgi:ribose-phosphate pyrophosphokinase